MTTKTRVHFEKNKAVVGREAQYADVHVDVAKILKSWRMSLFSHEWMLTDGSLKDLKELPPSEQMKRQAVELTIANGKALPKPILGIGLLDNVEIGMGKPEFLTLAALGHEEIPVHIPKSNESDFKDFITEVE